MQAFRPNAITDAIHHRTIRESLARSLQILKSSRSPDTFFGRKTQEPFPQEDEETRLAKWMASKELKPPE